ncbi:RNA polymerase sigma factor [Kineococcus sp. SYSU DK018]|uniref:RNA polymerase sigma factor n=1 Tax=Kineococcus sp. SYSU DK018 TaxID=3383139 RepID=UPI003D7F0381
MRALQPDRETRFRALYAQAYPDVLRFAARRAHPSHAEDVAADAFLVAWRRIDEVPPRHEDARAWLFGITRHCLLNAGRGGERRQALTVRLAALTAAGEPTHDGDADFVAQRVDVAAAWRRLSAAEQEALALHLFDDLTSPQAARVLGISAASYRVRLLRARRALRQHLEHPAPTRVQLENQP